jgi:hypothetical protein
MVQSNQRSYNAAGAKCVASLFSLDAFAEPEPRATPVGPSPSALSQRAAGFDWSRWIKQCDKSKLVNVTLGDPRPSSALCGRNTVPAQVNPSEILRPSTFE